MSSSVTLVSLRPVVELDIDPQPKLLESNGGVARSMPIRSPAAGAC